MESGVKCIKVSLVMDTADSSVKNTDLARVGFSFDYLQDSYIFSLKSSRPAPAPTQPTILCVPVVVWCMKLIAHHHIIPR